MPGSCCIRPQRARASTRTAREGVSPKARRTLKFLSENQGGSRQLDLAAELKVSLGRITQLKGELAAALAKYDYVGPLGPRPA